MFNWNTDAIVAQYPWLPLSHEAGFRQVLGFLAADKDITDIRHASYVLATTRHESAFTYEPIEEYGKGAGRAYGSPRNPDTGERDENGLIYCGRGYVQLTWWGNYVHFGKLLNLDLAHHPELAMVPENAYAIMSYGMRHGAFTGVCLSTFIHGDTCLYVAARKIINSLDQADKIADYADAFEHLLTQNLIKEPQ